MKTRFSFSLGKGILVLAGLSFLATDSAASDWYGLRPLATFANNGWLAPGMPETPYLASDHSARGMAYDPVTDRLYVASRTGATGVHVIDAATGQHLHSLDVTGVAGGTFPINMIGLTVDGVIYACNLSTVASDAFKIYRWTNGDPTTLPTVAFHATTGLSRTGDSFAVASSGIDTRIVASGSGHAAIAVFDTGDGAAFSLAAANTISGVPTGAFRLGMAFIDSNTTVGQQTGNSSLSVANLAASTGQVFQMKSIGEAPLAYFAPEQLLATVDIINNQVRLYDASNLSTLASTGFLDSANSTTSHVTNGNGTGDLTFGLGPDGILRLYVMNTNNGIQAFQIITEPSGLAPRDLHLAFTFTRSLSLPTGWLLAPNIRTTDTDWNLPIVVASPNGEYQGYINHPEGASSRSILFSTFSAFLAEMTGTWTITIDPGGEHLSRYFFSVDAAGLVSSRFAHFGVSAPGAGADLDPHAFFASWSQPAADTWDRLRYLLEDVNPYALEMWGNLDPDETGFYPADFPAPGQKRLRVLYNNDQGGFPEVTVSNPHFNANPAPFAWQVGTHTSQSRFAREFSINDTPVPLVYEWLADHFSPEDRHNPEVGGLFAAPQRDGVTNLEKYALGMAPSELDRSRLPLFSIAPPEDPGGPARMTLSFQIVSDDPALRFRIGVSSDLETWHFDEEGSDEIQTEVIDNADGTVTVKASGPDTREHDRGFMRLLLTYD